jgi:hypothetical protein
MFPRQSWDASHSAAEQVELQELRAHICEVLASGFDEQLLRRAVWTYVGAERHAGTSLGHTIIVLTELVEQANIAPMSVRQALMRQVTLWSVERYFSYLGDVVFSPGGKPASDAPMRTSNR